MTLSTHTKTFMAADSFSPAPVHFPADRLRRPAAPAPSEASSQAEAAASAYEQYDEDTF